MEKIAESESRRNHRSFWQNPVYKSEVKMCEVDIIYKILYYTTSESGGKHLHIGSKVTKDRIFCTTVVGENQDS